MAITLLGSGNDHVDYGDMSALSGITTFSIALTIKITTLAALRLVTQWSSANADRAFLLSADDNTPASNQLMFVVSAGGGSGTFFGRRTTALNMVAGGTYRIVATITFGSPPTMQIYANG